MELRLPGRQLGLLQTERKSKGKALVWSKGVSEAFASAAAALKTMTQNELEEEQAGNLEWGGGVQWLFKVGKQKRQQNCGGCVCHTHTPPPLKCHLHRDAISHVREAALFSCGKQAVQKL